MLLPLSLCCCSSKSDDSRLSLKRVIPLGVDGGLAVGGGVALFFLLRAFCPPLSLGGQIGVAVSFTLVPLALDIIALFLISRKKRRMFLRAEITHADIFMQASQAFIKREQCIDELVRALPPLGSSEQIRQGYINFIKGCEKLHFDITKTHGNLGPQLGGELESYNLEQVTQKDLDKLKNRCLNALKTATDPFIEAERIQLIQSLFDWVYEDWRCEIQGDKIFLPLYNNRSSSYTEEEGIHPSSCLSLDPTPERIYDVLEILSAYLKQNARTDFLGIHLSRQCALGKDCDPITITISDSSRSGPILHSLARELRPQWNLLEKKRNYTFNVLPESSNPLIHIHTDKQYL